MTLIKLSEFHQITGISLEALSRLLINNTLKCHIDEKKGIMVDIESIETKNLIESIIEQQRNAFERDKRIISEKLARIIGVYFEQITDDFLENFGYIFHGINTPFGEYAAAF